MTQQASPCRAKKHKKDQESEIPVIPFEVPRPHEEISIFDFELSDDEWEDVIEQRPSEKKKKKRNRQKTSTGNRHYHVRFRNFGMINDPLPCGKARPFCVLCPKHLSNLSLNDRDLKQHALKHINKNYKVKKKELSDHDKDYLQKCCDHYENRKTVVKIFTDAQKRNEIAAFLLALWISRNKLAHTAGEKYLKELIEVFLQLYDCGDVNLRGVYCSNDTIRKYIMIIASCIHEDLLREIRSSKFPISIQLDETTDTAGRSHLVVHVRYVHEENGQFIVRDDFLFSSELPGTSNAPDIYNRIARYFAENQLDIKKIKSICTDGARALFGKKTGVAARVRRVSKGLDNVQCALHCLNLAAQELSGDLEKTRDYLSKFVNKMRNCQKLYTAFSEFCIKRNEPFDNLLFFCMIRWLSNGEFLTRIFVLRKAILSFAKQKKALKEYVPKFQEHGFKIQLAYMVDIFAYLNKVNTSLQGENKQFIDVCAEVQCLKDSLTSWISQLRKEKPIFSNFENLQAMIDILKPEAKIISMIQAEMDSHLSSVLDKVKEKFKDYIYDEWVANPFLFNPETLVDGHPMKHNLIELKNNVRKKTLFYSMQERPLPEFWAQIAQDFPRLAEYAIQKTLIFPTTYPCEQSFSHLADIKPPGRNTKDVRADFRICRTTRTINTRYIEGIVERGIKKSLFDRKRRGNR